MASSEANEPQVATDLVQRIKLGDGDAEAELWRRYSRGLLFLLRRRTGNPDLAEDLRQEVFRIAIERLRDRPLEDPEKLAAFLRGIAANLVAGDYRKNARRNTTADSDAIDRVADEGTNPAELVSRQEIRELVKRLIDELPMARDREILTQFYVRDVDKDEICTELDIDSVHFNRVLFRAKQRLRELILREERKGKIKLVD
jgi:RNA polymerase sigma-70 factor (ECF subfamily)